MINPFLEIIERLERIELLLTVAQSTKTEIEIIDRQELMKRLNISEPTVILWGKKGKIPEMRIGANVRYNWPDVVKALSNK
jgi:hypothetical protein